MYICIFNVYTICKNVCILYTKYESEEESIDIISSNLSKNDFNNGINDIYIYVYRYAYRSTCKYTHKDVMIEYRRRLLYI